MGNRKTRKDVLCALGLKHVCENSISFYYLAFDCKRYCYDRDKQADGWGDGEQLAVGGQGLSLLKPNPYYTESLEIDMMGGCDIEVVQGQTI